MPLNTSNIAIRNLFTCISIEDKLYLNRMAEMLRIIRLKNGN